MADAFLYGATRALEARATVARLLQAAVAPPTVAPGVPVSTTTTVTTTETVVGEASEGWDRFMTFLTRIMDLMFLGTILGIMGLAYKFRNRVYDEVCASISIRPGRLCRLSDFLKCCQIITCDCFGICKCLGYDSITAPSRTLSITLVGLYNCKKSKEIFCEFSTDEINRRGHHSEVVKSSRVHRVDGKGFADMKGEKLDFDWYGDEYGLFGHLRSYNALRAYEYQPVLGEIFVPYHQIKEFAREARDSRHKKNGGARQFVVKPVHWKPPETRRPGFDGVQDGLMKSVMDMTKPAVSVPPEQRMHDLEFENENLRRQLRGEPPLEIPVVNDPNQDPSNFPSVVMIIEVNDYSHDQVASLDRNEYPEAPDVEISTWKTMSTRQVSSGYQSMAPGSSGA